MVVGREQGSRMIWSRGEVSEFLSERVLPIHFHITKNQNPIPNRKQKRLNLHIHTYLPTKQTNEMNLARIPHPSIFTYLDTKTEPRLAQKTKKPKEEKEKKNPHIKNNPIQFPIRTETHNPDVRPSHAIDR